MKRINIINIVFFILFASDTLFAQFPPIETIDFYGLRTISEKQIREKLIIKEGDDAPDQLKRAEIEKGLKSIPNVEDAKLNFACCTGSGKTMLYVGIREKGTPKTEFRTEPSGSIRLTNEIIEIGKQFEQAHRKAVLKGDVGEERDAGHSFMKNAEARAIQEKFIPIANQNLSFLRRVLRESSDAEHRALAAEIIAYYKDKSAIVDDLVFAANDANDAVRNNATRALGLIAGYAQKHSEKHINIPFELFVEMLNSIQWSDRNKSSLVLEELSRSRNPELIKLLRQKALPSLFEMARWKNDGHAGNSFFILGRVAGLSEDEIGRAWMTGKREVLLNKIKNTLN